MTYLLWALLLGGLSAVSLPFGSLVGIHYKFTDRQTSFLAAFGAGALLAALSVELIAPTTLNLLETEHQQDKSAFFNMVIGCVLGGILYILLDKAVNSKGGFLRKTSTLLSYYKKEQHQNQKKILDALSKNPLFYDFPSDHINDLMKSLRVKKYSPGDIVLEQKSETTEIGIITAGELELFLNSNKVAELSPKDILISILSAITGKPEFGEAIAKTESTIPWIKKEDLDRFRKLSPNLNKTLTEIAENRFDRLKEIAQQKKEEIIGWIEKYKSDGYWQLSGYQYISWIFKCHLV